jgi:DNA polymerase III epsilon subunit-like protein
MNAVFQEDMRPLFGQFSQDRGFPDDYFLFDFETSGFSRQDDVITQIGWAIIRGRQIVDNQSLTLNWQMHPGMNQMWLEWRLADLAVAYRKEGKPYRLTYKVLGESPYEPISTLQMFDELLASVLESNEWIIGHNLAIFDTGMMDAHRIRFLDAPPLEWPANRIFDTGLFVKAAQMGRYPSNGETLMDFFRSVSGLRAKGIFWALDKYCIPAFELDTRFGVDVSKCHDGGYDCRVNYHLFEAMREIGENHR